MYNVLFCCSWFLFSFQWENDQSFSSLNMPFLWKKDQRAFIMMIFRGVEKVKRDMTREKKVSELVICLAFALELLNFYQASNNRKVNDISKYEMEVQIDEKRLKIKFSKVMILLLNPFHFLVSTLFTQFFKIIFIVVFVDFKSLWTFTRSFTALVIIR